ncbi:13727_t:CDS:1, partial [Dentiscutata heterogama]
QECFVIVWATTYFCQYLHGSCFTLVTDYLALELLLKNILSKGLLTCWILFLQEYEFVIVYYSGKQHSNTDSLSHIINSSDQKPGHHCPYCLASYNFKTKLPLSQKPLQFVQF